MLLEFKENMLTSATFYQVVSGLVGVFVMYRILKYFTDILPNKVQPNATVNRRQLGYFEEMCDIFTVNRAGSGNICVVMSITSKLSLVHQHLRDALILVAKRQPMLRAVITTMSNGNKYFEIKEIDKVIAMLNITTSVVKSSNWQDVWFGHTSKQRGNGLLWRVAVLKEEFSPDTKEYANTLMFNFNHSCIDGVSCVKFCKQLLARMNEVANGTICPEQKVSSLDLLPYYHDIITHGRFWHSLFKSVVTFCGLRPILKYIMGKILVRVTEKKPMNPYQAQFPTSQETQVNTVISPPICRVFTLDETNKIVKACKTNNSTVTGAVIAAIHIAYCQILQSDKSKDLMLDYMFSINGQRFCKPKPANDYLGVILYNSDYKLKYLSATNVDFWKLAREISQELKNIVRNEAFVTQMTVLNQASEPKELIDQVFDENSLSKSMCNYISSLGSFRLDQMTEQSAAYNMNNCYINTLAPDMNCNFCHFVYTINGQMTWQIAISVVVDGSHADKFCSLCFDKLIEMSGALIGSI